MHTVDKPHLRLFVVSHKDIPLPEATYLYSMRSDRSDGINIAKKSNYCELRAQYWIWKNKQYNNTDYVGFFHYRRYLNLSEHSIFSVPAKRRPIPYFIQEKPCKELYSDSRLKNTLMMYDVIAPVWEYTGVSVWDRYQMSNKQRIQDLTAIYQIIREKYPQYLDAADAYLSGHGEYFGNIYLMRWDYFQTYCQWLFSILTEFDQRTPDAPPSTDGFLGERLFGIYFTYLIAQPEVRCGECPRLHYYIYDDATHHIKSERIINIFLRPGSKLRSIVRNMYYKLRGM